MNRRKSAMKDCETLADLRGRFLTELYQLTREEQALMVEESRRYLAEQLNQTLTCYQIEIAGDTVGTAFLEVRSALPHPVRKGGKIGTILNVYVVESARGKGLAGALVEALIEEGKQQKLDRLELQATIAGYPLYRKLGFEERTLTDRLMELELK